LTTENLRIEQRGAVTKVWIDNITYDWTQWLLLRSDAHHDSLHCNRGLEKKHLDEAKAKDALILDGGDLFDAMQGRFDPRRNLDDVRPEHKTGRYYDAILDDAVEYYRPYADNWLLLAKGNHESSVYKNINTDLTSRLQAGMGGKSVIGGYGGWVIFYFNAYHTRSSMKIKYFHGAGGEAPVTKGVIQTNRQAVYLPDANVVWNGHNHNEYTITQKRERITTKGELYFDLCHFVRTPGYKDDYANGTGGWEVERGMMPKPQGAVWLQLTLDHERVKCKAIADVE